MSPCCPFLRAGRPERRTQAGGMREKWLINSSLPAMLEFPGRKDRRLFWRWLAHPAVVPGDGVACVTIPWALSLRSCSLFFVSSSWGGSDLVRPV